MKPASLIQQQQVLLTLAYSHIFSFPLKTDEVVSRLLMLSQSVKEQSAVLPALKTLQQLGLIKKRGEFWLLSSASPDLIATRKKRERLSSLKLRELAPFLSFARRVPWILGVAVTGSVSVSNAEAKDDVDLMIVVQDNRLWLVRPIVVLFSFLKGKRRSWNHEEFNSWCLNLWLEEDSLSVPISNRSAYTAYEVCQALWLVDKHSTEYAFLAANAWVARYLPLYYVNKFRLANQKHYQQSWSLLEGFWKTSNKWAYSVQRWYMNRHMTREKVGYSFAFFHPRDTRANIFQVWKDLLRQL